MRRSRWGAYPLEISPLYRLQSKRKLAELLCTNVRSLKRLARRENNYFEFTANPGTEKEREIQSPLPWLERIHIRIFDLLRRIKPPDYLKSGVRGESQITNAQVHVGNDRGFKFDIKRFYPSVKRTHVFACFYTIFEMAPDVADLLADICTINGTLPTGSTLSGDLAFMANLRMFEKLSEIADERGLDLSIWVDDITVTGESANRPVCSQMISVVESHGFTCHKVAFFKPSIPRIITGVAIHNGQMFLPNKRHKKIHERLIDLDEATTLNEYLKTAESVIGMMEAADQVQQKYAVRKKLLRREFIALGGRPAITGPVVNLDRVVGG